MNNLATTADIITAASLYELLREKPPIEIWARFYPKCNVRGWDDCWEWLKTSRNPKGYGQFKLKVTKSAYRLMFIWMFGQPLERLVIDHICKNKACVNPIHLRMCTNRENCLRDNLGVSAINARKTHCLNGHDLLDRANLDDYFFKKDGRRICKICLKETMSKAYKKHRRKKKEARIQLLLALI